MWRELWDAFCDWASDAWNWLKSFFKKIWKEITSWWTALREFLEDLIDALTGEVEVIDPNTNIGQDIVKKIREIQPETKTMDYYDSKIVITVDKNTDGIRKVANLAAEKVKGISDFDKDLAQQGIIRLKN